MADYSLTRIKDVPNVGEGFASPDDFEIRFLRDALALTSSGVSWMRYSAGYNTPFGHRQKKQEEVYILISGHATVKLEDELVEMAPLSALRVPPETARAFRASGDADAIFIAVGAPATGPGDGEPDMEFWVDS